MKKKEIKQQLKHAEKTIEQQNAAAQKILDIIMSEFNVKVEPPIGLTISGKNNTVRMNAGSTLLSAELIGDNATLAADSDNQSSIVKDGET